MTTYKGIDIDPELAGIIRQMQGVEAYREVLGKLQGAWDILCLLGQLTGAATEMSGTREAFEKLTGDLLNHLGRETRRKAIADLRSKAQISIDILVRNLFERTADIGFLAADDDIREFLISDRSQRAQLERRFQEYVAKYSVYSDIVLFDARGRIAARLQPHPATQSEHDLLELARTTPASFVECFTAGDFLPDGQHLVYAFRVDDGHGSVIGTLALVFRLEDEMRGIFSNLLDETDFTLLATFDGSGQVVASSCAIQLPVGTRLDRTVREARGQVVRLAGREYLASACRAHSYQGYPGPGWFGLGLIPLEFAFTNDDHALLGNIDPRVVAAVARHPTLFSEALRRIPAMAEHIQEDLNRSVWNGSVRQVDAGGTNVSFAKTLLWEISNTGRKTQATFEQSIGNLHETVIAALLQNGVARAAFAIDVMDRNLYERANDCRWWALNATFRRTLATPQAHPEDLQSCAGILRYINGLYTVYHTLILYNAQGQVVAVSNPDSQNLVGTRLTEDWVGRSLALDSSQGYVVSQFAPTPLYGGQPTYIYAAAIHAPDSREVVGGIGIVFDGTPQFNAMLGDALPRDSSGQTVAGTLALFTTRDGRVLASTSSQFPPGSRFPLGEAQSHLGQGERCADIIVLDGTYYALGAALSAGYREYKTSDGHADDVLSLSAFPLGSSDLDAESVPPAATGNGEGRARRIGQGDDFLEIATFYIDNQWLGMPASHVVEAVSTDDLTPVLGGNNDLVAGVKMYRGNLISVLHLPRLLNPDTPIPEKSRQIIIVRTHDNVCLGILVDQLGEIPEIARNEIQSVSPMAVGSHALTVGVVNGLRPPGDRHGLLSILGADRLCRRIGCQCLTPEAAH